MAIASQMGGAIGMGLAERRRKQGEQALVEKVSQWAASGMSPQEMLADLHSSGKAMNSQFGQQVARELAMKSAGVGSYNRDTVDTEYKQNRLESEKARTYNYYSGAMNNISKRISELRALDPDGSANEIRQLENQARAITGKMQTMTGGAPSAPDTSGVDSTTMAAPKIGNDQPIQYPRSPEIQGPPASLATPSPTWAQTIAQIPGQVVTIATDDEYDKLPSGTIFVGPDGKRRKKP